MSFSPVTPTYPSPRDQGLILDDMDTKEWSSSALAKLYVNMDFYRTPSEGCVSKETIPETCTWLMKYEPPSKTPLPNHDWNLFAFTPPPDPPIHLHDWKTSIRFSESDWGLPSFRPLSYKIVILDEAHFLTPEQIQEAMRLPAPRQPLDKNNG